MSASDAGQEQPVRSPRPAWLFRVARPSNAGRNLVKTAVQVVIVWTFALALLPAIVVRIESELGFDHPGSAAGGAAGVVIFAAGSTTGLWSAWLMAVRGEGTPVPFDAARVLVIEGPYRVVRNPMAVSAIVQTLGVAVALGSPGTVGLALGGGVVWHVVIRPPEERFLEHQFGEPYRRYRDAVRCWWPTWPPYRAATW